LTEVPKTLKMSGENSRTSQMKTSSKNNLSVETKKKADGQLSARWKKSCLTSKISKMRLNIKRTILSINLTALETMKT
jgi:hypothetical protein